MRQSWTSPACPSVENSTQSTSPTTMLDVTLRFLKMEGVTHVFGIPGGLLHPFFDAVECDDELSLVVTKHECGAVFIADGYARTAGKLAVVAATSGPGATNLITGVSCAFSDGVPMLVITGQAQSTTLGKGAAQETAPEDIDIVGMFRPVTKYSAMVGAPDRITHHLQRALRSALSGRPGPVHVNVPVNFWLQFVGASSDVPATYRPSTEAFDRRQVRQASTALLAARRPVFLVGSGAATLRATELVVALAERLGARVATTPRGKGLFPEDHPLSLGVFGFAGHLVAQQTLVGGVGECDLLFTIGASLNETTTLNWHSSLVLERQLMQLDIDVDRMGRNYPVQWPLVGDSETILLELQFQLQREIEHGYPVCSTWSEVAPPPRGDERYLNSPLRSSEAIPLTPQRWRAELSYVLPNNAIVFSDIGGHMLFNLQHLEIREQQQFVLNLGFGSMGHGTAAPIGAAMGCPNVPIVAVIGDACFTMQGMELLTAVEYDAPVVWIVENNPMHGITWHGSKLVNKGRPMQSIVYRRPLAIAAMADAMGLGVSAVSRPGEMGPAVQHAFKQRRPWLIDVSVDPAIGPPLGDRAKAVAGFKRS